MRNINLSFISRTKDASLEELEAQRAQSESKCINEVCQGDRSLYQDSWSIVSKNAQLTDTHIESIQSEIT